MTAGPSPQARPSRRARLWPIAIAVAAVGALAWALATQRSHTVFDAESPFGRVRVVERGDGLRTLYTGAGRARQSALYPGRPLHLELPYTRVAVIGLALAPPDARILFVGLGGGALPMYARAVLPEARIDVVEIDPLIVEVARQWFGFVADERMTVHTADGRAFIEDAPPRSWDLVVLDAFADDDIPVALTTVQFLEAVRARLAPGGIVVSNLWSAGGAYPSMLATYRAVFEELRLIRVPARTQRILIATSGGRLPRAAVVRAAQALERRAQLGFGLARLVASGWQAVPAVDAPILEDDGATLRPSVGEGERIRTAPS